MNKISIRYTPAISLSLLIFILSSIPGLGISEIYIYDIVFRKLAHLSIYFLLYISYLWAITDRKLNKASNQQLAMAFIFGLLFAISDEFHQSLVPDRAGTLIDVIIDVIGMLLALYGTLAKVSCKA